MISYRRMCACGPMASGSSSVRPPSQRSVRLGHRSLGQIHLPVVANGLIVFGRRRFKDDYRLPRHTWAPAFERPAMCSCPCSREKSMVPVLAARNDLPRNRLLAALSRDDRALLLPHLKPAALGLPRTLTPQSPDRHCLFYGVLVSCRLSPSKQTRRGSKSVHRPRGHERDSRGAGGNRSPHSTYIQVAGEGQRMPANDLRKATMASQSSRVPCLNSSKSLHGTNRPHRHRQTLARTSNSAADTVAFNGAYRTGDTTCR